MSREPKMTAWTFTYYKRDGTPLFRTTVETPTKLGAEHAERVAFCDLKRRPFLLKHWNGKNGTLDERKGANEHRRDRDASIARIKRETPSRRKFGADFYIPSNIGY